MRLRKWPLMPSNLVTNSDLKRVLPEGLVENRVELEKPYNYPQTSVDKRLKHINFLIFRTDLIQAS